MAKSTSIRTSNAARGVPRLAAAALATLSVFVLTACGSSGSGSGDAPDYDSALSGSPPKLAALHDQSGELLSGGQPAFEKRIRELRGYPIVVNKWASWCGPCRSEFPYIQSQSAKHGTKVAFLGVDANDGEDSAKTFLSELPVPYPSYVDPDQEIAKSIEADVAFPSTAFYDKTGKRVFVRAGTYASEADLAADIKRYAR
jgi:cytochrome c biogenesis protein CcmG, thiol:disulfide interchange protein DsbE